MSRTLEGLADSQKTVEIARKLRDGGDYEAYQALCEENDIDEQTTDRFWNGLCDDFDTIAPADTLEAPEAPQDAVLPCGGISKVATAKLDAELKAFKGGRKEAAVSSHVATTLKQFCKNEQFAMAVANCKKNLSACCEEIMKSVGTSISDIEVYRRAAKFYFPGSVVKFSMEIQIDGVSTAAEAPTDVLSPAAASSTNAPRKRTALDKPKKKGDSNIIQISLFED